ncbi:xanthine dehydrogenase family protein molybdopterin-binding subunit [Vineibacter terrae]|uniref:Xanthine dehydrogenase family protein molybdopterin-binding subunit n=1 Tax=Vineibacter terrae TaxID=2586908 RepID=A0A5C8P6Y4_9HYPH|nr:xanthine dehydrogenase family protein molybdopterin-binding subunit [Vineibacter terrae]TXL69113.1 xanthine dehydrogenase family protein molybdopterin-binding subunit [Vineibacter terrae]
MNAPFDAIKFESMKFGIGQPVPRREDPTLLRGQGRYTDDLSLPDQAYAVMVRSQVAHGVIKAIDTAQAKAMPGVLGVWTGAELNAAGYGPLKTLIPVPNRDGTPMKTPTRYSLATDKVRFVGDPVAVVVAETVAQAKDAAEAVMLEIEALPAVTDARAGAEAGAPLVFDDVPGNICLDFHYGDSAKVAEAFAAAAHVTRLRLISNRIVVCAMEPRAAIGHYDPATDRYTLHAGNQGAFGLKHQMAALLGIKPAQMRILTGNVGGSFGMKGSPYPEYAGLFHASKLLGRPVKWTDERSGSFLSDQHGRDHDFDAELALDKDGNFLAVRLNGFANVGAYLANVGPLMGSMGVTRNLAAIYRTPLIEVSSRIVFTNTSPVGAYRGAGRPEANYFMERLIDTAAREMGIDHIALRRRNHIRPEEMPYKTASGTTYDSGEFTALLDKALQLADVDGFAARKAESARRGKLRGLGVGDYLEVTAPPQKEMGGLRFEPNGDVSIITGTLDYGQGHWSAFAQVLHEKLGIPFERIRLIQGDSDLLIAGGGTGGSKSIMASGAAIVEASDKVIDKGRQIAGVALEAAAADIEFKAGRFTIVGTDRGIGIMDLAEKLRGGMKLPEGVPGTLDVSHVHEAAPSAFPNGAHVAEVEVDPDTGTVAVVKYTMVSDFGTVINPLLVEGQSHGGVVQGIAQALFERTVYSEDGQFLTGSFTDYALPRASDVPFFQMAYHAVPARTNVLGAKGCGEAGCAGSLPSVMNALVDALGGRHIDMPATPERVWEALRG